MSTIENRGAVVAPEPPAAAVLNLRGVVKRFGQQVAVNEVSLTIQPHEIVGLIGENGAGKSTLLKILAGVFPPDAGSIEVNGRITRFRSPLESAAHRIGVVHQEQSLFTNLTVGENIVMSAAARGTRSTRFGFYRWGQIYREAREILERIGSRIDPRTRMSDLSFASRQMVEIARAIHVDKGAEGKGEGTPGQQDAAEEWSDGTGTPRLAMLEVKIARAITANQESGAVPLVILDEPTSVLERNETEILEREIRKLKDVGSVIFVSHRLDEVLRICDRIVVMRHGKIVADRPRASIEEDELFTLMIGHAARAEQRVTPATAHGTPLIRAEGLGRKGWFRDVSFSVVPGRALAVVGTFGSGREELCRAIFGAETFDRGTLSVAGRAVRRWSVRDAIRAGIAYLPSERRVEGLVGGMSAARNLTLTHPGRSRLGPFLRPGTRDRIAGEWFERLDVRPRDPGLDLDRFSGGNQQKVVLAKWLAAADLKVLILDHPLRGLDPGAMETVTAQIRAACRGGAGLILLADTLEEALDLGDEIIVMRDGEITARFDLSRERPTTLDLLEKMV